MLMEFLNFNTERQMFYENQKNMRAALSGMMLFMSAYTPRRERLEHL